MFFFGRLLVVTLLLFHFCGAIPIDNGVDGKPEVNCGVAGISVGVKTINNFQGRIFVKGRFNDTDCRNTDATFVDARRASLDIEFNKCGVARSRSLNPRGVFIGFVVVISFHPLFLTKVDRAYEIQCFYMEADKTVSQEVEVSDLTTVFKNETVPMPICRYEILDGAPDAKPIKFASIGQKVYHKWTCATLTTDTFCMRVHHCFVTDGTGNNADILDPNGCALDKYLLGNLDYTTDLMAGKESHAFKFADVPSLFFQCQIAISIKEAGELCQLPKCDEPQRGKRSAEEEETNQDTSMLGIVDVVSQRLFAFDIEDQVYLPEFPNQPQESKPNHFQEESKQNETCIMTSRHLVWILSIMSLMGTILTCVLFSRLKKKRS